MSGTAPGILKGSPLCLLAALAGCATSPLEEPDALEVAELPALPRAICIDVEVESEEPLYGGKDEWSSALIAAFERLNVASEVWTSAERSARDADMVVRVALGPRSPAEPVTDTQGAVLHFFAWSTVPFVPCWITDTYVDPGLRVAVARELSGDREGIRGDAFNSPVIKTCFRDRYPWLSWTSLGALFVPPFVFESGDPEHLREAIEERVRMDVALRVAEFLKKEPVVEKEILSSFAITEDAGGPVLEYEALPEMGKLAVWLDGTSRPQPKSIPLLENGPGRRRLPLRAILSAEPAGERLLRMEAVHRGDGRTFRYSVLIPEAPAAGGS